jgi:hypothetical protein
MLRHEQRVTLPADFASPRIKLVSLYLARIAGATVTKFHHALASLKIALLTGLESLAVNILIQHTEIGYVPR